jgi:hypothetical protein
MSSAGVAELPVYASWDEAEEMLERLQQTGLVPFWPEPGGAEFRIIDIGERHVRRRSANGPPSTARV